MIKELKKNFIDSISTIFPLVCIVFIISIFIPLNKTILLSFFISAIIMIVGSTLFTFGAELSMIVIGNKIGKDLVKSNKIWLILLASLIIGTVITLAEPDLLILAEQITSIPKMTLVLIISTGVGLCLVLASIRSLFGWNLNIMLMLGFIIIFTLVFFVPQDFIPLAFDSGGVTTGTLSIPFILTLGMGLVANRVDKKAKEESFGLISLASTGPIIMVLVLGLFYNSNEPMVFDNSLYLNFTFFNYLEQLKVYFKDVLTAISPILIVFSVYKIFTENVTNKELHKIILGTLITIIGLALFLVACNVGFLNMGYHLGEYISNKEYKYLLIPITMILAYFIAIAEPAVIILIDQVSEFTGGGISKRSLKISLALGVSIAAGLSILRVFAGIPFFYFAITGYGVALLLMFAIPKIFTAIAFDAGGATGGSLTTAFLLPIAIGASLTLEGNVYTDAFGLASMVSLVPIITIEIVGFMYQIKSNLAIRLVEALDDTIVDYNWEASYGKY